MSLRRVGNGRPAARPPVQSSEDEEQDNRRTEADRGAIDPLRERNAEPGRVMSPSDPIRKRKKREDCECNRPKARQRDPVGSGHRVWKCEVYASISLGRLLTMLLVT